MSKLIKEAVVEYNELVEAANTVAKTKLAEEFPNQFNKFLKEELNKKNIKESDENIKPDENKESENKDEKIKEESVMKKMTKETEKVEEVAGDGKPFDAKAKIEEITKETKEKVEEVAGDGKPFDEKSKKTLQTEEFDVTGSGSGNVGTAIEGANNDDDNDFITIDELEEEIAKLEGDKPNESECKNPLEEKLNQMKSAIEEIMNEMQQSKFADEPKDVTKLHNNGATDALIDEESPITDADIEAVLGSSESEDEQVEEAHGVGYNVRRNASGRSIPGSEYLSSIESDQAPASLQESKLKFNKMLEENKRLTKKLNELSSSFKKTTELTENYKLALDKYRNQLKEMAVFNTNLANVNNLLVNEELALTQDDKVKIINDFKKVNTISESQELYKSTITEMKEGKKTITESIEDKVNVSISPSSKKILDEVVEKTAYSTNESLLKMKKNINYLENRGKKK